VRWKRKKKLKGRGETWETVWKNGGGKDVTMKCGQNMQRELNWSEEMSPVWKNEKAASPHGKE